MAAARSRILPAVLLLLLAIVAAPRAFVGPSRTPPAQAPGAAVAGMAAAGQARSQGSSLAASTAAVLLLAAAAASGRAASAARRAWPLGKSTKQEILELEELSQGKDSKEKKKRRWFPFGRKKEAETIEEPDKLKQLMEETQDLFAKVELLDKLSADVEPVDAREEELAEATAKAAVNELEAGTVEPTELLAEDAVVEASQDEKEPEPEVAETEEEEEEKEEEEEEEEEAQELVEEAPAEATVPESVPGPEVDAAADEPAAVAQEPTSAAEEASEEIADELVAAAEEPLVATEAELPIAEKPEVDQAPALEMSAATEVEVPPEGQEVTVDPVDEQREVLENALNMAKALEADNLRLKEDLKLAQKMCFELLDDKDRDEESAAAM